jgi:hypothetical protein
VQFDAGHGGRGPEKRALPATDVKKGGPFHVGRPKHVEKGIVHGSRVIESGETPPGLRRFARVAGVFGPTVLRLKKGERARAADVERVVPDALPSVLPVRERLCASANRTPKLDPHD